MYLEKDALKQAEGPPDCQIWKLMTPCTIHNNVYLSTQSKQKGLQNYSGNTFLSLELSGGGQIWKLIKGKWLSLAIPNNMHLAKNAVK